MDRKKLLHTYNLPKHILNQVAGKQHPIWSRLLVGFLIMLVSTMIADTVIIMAAVRELVHAIGAIPYIEWLVNNADENPDEKIIETNVSKNLDIPEKQHTFELPKTKYMTKTFILNTALIIALIAVFFAAFYVYKNLPQMKASEAVNMQLIDQSLSAGK